MLQAYNWNLEAVLHKLIYWANYVDDLKSINDNTTWVNTITSNKSTKNREEIKEWNMNKR